ncbi:hypothetical protein V502_04759 [Pseudogymnoascus sp. VKM F-4520 (FW-2644)]|nr:hypothetical protein V502_04759 [Pseudogymnoascus sp. VKM F-4520 (FW-2644)]
MHNTTQVRFSEVHAPGSREPAARPTPQPAPSSRQLAIQPATTPAPAPAPQLAHSPSTSDSKIPVTAAIHRRQHSTSDSSHTARNYTPQPGQHRKKASLDNEQAHDNAHSPSIYASSSSEPKKFLSISASPHRFSVLHFLVSKKRS